MKIIKSSTFSRDILILYLNNIRKEIVNKIKTIIIYLFIMLSRFIRIFFLYKIYKVLLSLNNKIKLIL